MSFPIPQTKFSISGEPECQLQFGGPTGSPCSFGKHEHECPGSLQVPQKHKIWFVDNNSYMAHGFSSYWSLHRAEVRGFPQHMRAGWAWFTCGSWVNHWGHLSHLNNSPQLHSTLFPSSSNHYLAQTEAEQLSHHTVVGSGSHHWGSEMQRSASSFKGARGWTQPRSLQPTWNTSRTRSTLRHSRQFPQDHPLLTEGLWASVHNRPME